MEDEYKYKILATEDGNFAVLRSFIDTLDLVPKNRLQQAKIADGDLTLYWLKQIPDTWKDRISTVLPNGCEVSITHVIEQDRKLPPSLKQALVYLNARLKNQASGNIPENFFEKLRTLDSLGLIILETEIVNLNMNNDFSQMIFSVRPTHCSITDLGLHFL